MGSRTFTAAALRGAGVVDGISRTLAVIAGTLCLLLMVNVVADVIGRAVGQPLPGTLDIVQFAWMPSIASLGLGYALLAGQHIRVGLLTDAASSRLARVVEIAAMALTFATVAAFVWFGIERAITATQLGEHPVTSPWIPVWAFRWVLVVGLAGLALQAVAQIVRALTAPHFAFDDDDMSLVEESETVNHETSVSAEGTVR